MMAVGGAAVAGGMVGAVAGNALYNADFSGAEGMFRLPFAFFVLSACEAVTDCGLPARVRPFSVIIVPALCAVLVGNFPPSERCSWLARN